MIALIAYVVLVIALAALIYGWVSTERGIAYAHARHVEQHESVLRSAEHAPVVWPGYDADCDICAGRR